MHSFINKYKNVSSGEIVQATQWKGDTYKTIYDFTHGQFYMDDDNGYVYFRDSEDKKHQVRVNDWIVKGENLRFNLYNSDHFNLAFEKIIGEDEEDSMV